MQGMHELEAQGKRLQGISEQICTRERRIYISKTKPTPQKGKNDMVDEDGFQPVTNMKHTRRNVFVEHSDKRHGTREPSGERPAHEIHSGPGVGGPHATRRAGSHEATCLMGETSKVTAPPRAATKEQSHHGQAAEMLASEEDPAGKMAAPISEEGRGDPASTMLWSPDKIIGSKRALEECAESEDESEGGKRDGEGSRDEEGSTHNEMELDDATGNQEWAKGRNLAKRRTTPN